MVLLTVFTISGFDLAFGHGVSTMMFSRPVRIDDESFSNFGEASHWPKTSTENGSIIITGKLVSLSDQVYSGKLTIIAYGDEIEKNPTLFSIIKSMYGRGYAEDAQWYFQTKTDFPNDIVTLGPHKVKDYSITVTPLKAGKYHIHTFLSTQNGKFIAPGGSIEVDGSSLPTLGEIFGLYLKFSLIITLLGFAIFLTTRKRGQLIGLLEKLPKKKSS